MLRTDIFKNGLDNVSSNDLRSLMYLSRNNAWVNLAGQLYKFKIKDLIETTKRREGTAVYFGKKFHPLSERGELQIKLLISRLAIRASVCGVSSNSSAIKASEDEVLPDVNLNANFVDYDDLRIHITGRRIIEIHAVASNFDFEFLTKFNSLDDIEKRRQCLVAYKQDREVAQLDATKNAIWLAAVSGDSQQLQLLLDDYPGFNVKSLYNEKNILQAIFDADPTLDLPFKNDKPDYMAAIDLLILHGLDQPMMVEVYQKYKSRQDGLMFFQRGNPVHTELLSILESKIGVFLEKDVDNDVGRKGACRIM